MLQRISNNVYDERSGLLDNVDDMINKTFKNTCYLIHRDIFDVQYPKWEQNSDVYNIINIDGMINKFNDTLLIYT